MSAVTRCAGPACAATAPPIVAAARWASLAWAGRVHPVCSQDCGAAVLEVLVTVGGLARQPAPGTAGPAGGVTARRRDGVTAGRR